MAIKKKKNRMLFSTPQLFHKMTNHLQNSSWMIDRLLPHHCPICFQQTWQKGLCADCWQHMAFIHPPYCDRCGKPLHAHGLVPVCGRCWQDKSPKGRTRSTIHYDDMARRLILPLKHGDRLDLVPLIARFMMPAFDELASDNHLIVPIPSHLWRRVKRRYNQSTELARHLCYLSRHEAHLTTTLLTRTRYTPSLARHNAVKRHKILKHAFAVSRTACPDLSHHPILLIDDVITTGATMEAAAHALRKAGARQIDKLSFARVL